MATEQRQGIPHEEVIAYLDEAEVDLVMGPTAGQGRIASRTSAACPSACSKTSTCRCSSSTSNNCADGPVSGRSHETDEYVVLGSFHGQNQARAFNTGNHVFYVDHRGPGVQTLTALIRSTR